MGSKIPPRPSENRHGLTGSMRHALLLSKLKNTTRPQPSRRLSASTPPSSPGSLHNHRLRLHSSLGLRPISRLLSPPLLGSLPLRPILRLWSSPPSHSLWLLAPPRSPLLPPRRDRSVPPLLPQPGPWYPLPPPLRLGLPCPRRLLENPANPRPPHPDRSWSRGLTGSPNTYRSPRHGMMPTWSSPFPN